MGGRPPIQQAGGIIDLFPGDRFQFFPVPVGKFQQWYIVRMFEIGLTDDPALPSVRAQGMRDHKLLQPQHRKASFGKMIACGRAHRPHAQYDHVKCIPDGHGLKRSFRFAPIRYETVTVKP